LRHPGRVRNPPLRIRRYGGARRSGPVTEVEAAYQQNGGEETRNDREAQASHTLRLAGSRKTSL